MNEYTSRKTALKTPKNRKLPNFSKKVTEFLKENKSRASQAMYIYNIRTIQICKTSHYAMTETCHGLMIS